MIDAVLYDKIMFGKTLVPGDYLEVYGNFVKGAGRFTLNIRDKSSHILIHITFRPDRRTTGTVMNR